MAIKTRTFVLAIAANIAAGTQSSLATECTKFGQPGYTATRQENLGPEKITSKVYVQGNKERVEFTLQGERQLRIMKYDAEMIVENLDKKTGVSLKLPKQSGSTKKVDFKTEETDTGYKITAPGPKGKKNIKYETVCREDGVTLSRKFPMFVKGRAVQASYVHTDINLTAIDPALFAPPEGVKLTKK